MKPPSPVMGDVANILQDMSSSPPSFTQPPSSSPNPFSATSNVVHRMISPTVSNSTPVTTQSTSESWPHSLSSDSQQLTPIPTTTASATNLSVFTGISETPENNVFEHFKLSCRISPSPDADSNEEWDFLDDFKLPLPAKLSLETEKNKEISDADGDEEWEILDDLKNVIPRPTKKAWETGKFEEVLFEAQANLYMFVDKKWKEQNLCIVKILRNCYSGRVRLLMRKEKVLKACANHYITPDMEIHRLKNFDHSWAWEAQDFVNEDLEPEHFLIRFKDAELATAFKVAFIKAVNIAKALIGNNLSSSKDETTDSHVISKPFRSRLSYPAATWCCSLCETTNVADRQYCVICETSKPYVCGMCKYSSGTGNHCCERECDSYSMFPMVYDINIAEDSRTNNLCSSKIPTTDNLVIPESFELKSWCCPHCETNNESDKRFCVTCETAKPFCCNECNIYAMLSDDSMSSDDENYN